MSYLRSVIDDGFSKVMDELGSIITAPARGMTALPPDAPKTDSPLGNWLLKAHQEIDPVRAFGGYGNIAAMALPPGARLAPAIRMRGGKVVSGKPGETHADLLTPEVEHMPGFAAMEDGFVAPNGSFLTRAEAMDLVKSLDPKFRSESSRFRLEGGLDAADIVRAIKE